MIKIEYPAFDFKIRKEKNTELIFDTMRKRWLLLTPEEWVRQNFLQYIVQIKNYPASLIAIEKEIYLGELKKRCDIVVYNRDTLPWMIIECKEMNERLNAKVLDQILRYHITLPAKYLVITNGSYCFAFVDFGQDAGHGAAFVADLHRVFQRGDHVVERMLLHEHLRVCEALLQIRIGQIAEVDFNVFCHGFSRFSKRERKSSKNVSSSKYRELRF